MAFGGKVLPRYDKQLSKVLKETRIKEKEDPNSVRASAGIGGKGGGAELNGVEEEHSRLLRTGSKGSGRQILFQKETGQAAGPEFAMTSAGETGERKPYWGGNENGKCGQNMFIECSGARTDETDVGVEMPGRRLRGMSGHS